MIDYHIETQHLPCFIIEGGRILLGGPNSMEIYQRMLSNSDDMTSLKKIVKYFVQSIFKAYTIPGKGFKWRVPLADVIVDSSLLFTPEYPMWIMH